MSNDLFTTEEQAIMQQHQQIRRMIVQKMTDNGVKIPENEEDRAFLMKAMETGDKVILSKAKLKSEDEATKTQGAATALITNLLLNIGPKAKRSTALPSERDVPVYNLDTVLDETAVGIRTFSVKEIMAAGQPETPK